MSGGFINTFVLFVYRLAVIFLMTIKMDTMLIKRV
ncbi:Protein of unknown function [Bacillus cytotoxicus]|nr:Protein of unknown function [Bacillus cytotoxicus]